MGPHPPHSAASEPDTDAAPSITVYRVPGLPVCVHGIIDTRRAAQGAVDVYLPADGWDESQQAS